MLDQGRRPNSTIPGPMLVDEWMRYSTARHEASRRLEKAIANVDASMQRIETLLKINALKRRVLVVDDDADARRLTADTIRKGVDVHVDESTSFDAKNNFSTKRHAVVVVSLLLDGGENGIDLLLSFGRGPRAVLVADKADENLTKAASVAHAVPLARPAADIAALISTLLFDAMGEL